jgi:hypothetical protein
MKHSRDRNVEARSRFAEVRGCKRVAAQDEFAHLLYAIRSLKTESNSGTLNRNANSWLNRLSR